MKIQKHLGRKIGDKIYYKYVVVIPDEILEESGLKAGDELVAEAGKKELKLKKK